MFSFFKKAASKETLVLQSPATLPVSEVFAEVEPEYADIIRTFTIGKRTVSLRLYKNGKIRRFLSSTKAVKERDGRASNYRYNDEMESLFNMSLDKAVIQTRKELRNMSRKENVEFRQEIKPKPAEVVSTPAAAVAIPNVEAKQNPEKQESRKVVSEKDLNNKKLVGQGKLLSYGIADQTRRKKGDPNAVEKFSCFCVDIEDKTSKATERLLGADLERALTEAQVSTGDEIEIFLMAVKNMGESRTKNYYEIRLIN